MLPKEAAGCTQASSRRCRSSYTLIKENWTCELIGFTRLWCKYSWPELGSVRVDVEGRELVIFSFKLLQELEQFLVAVAEGALVVPGLDLHGFCRDILLASQHPLHLFGNAQISGQASLQTKRMRLFPVSHFGLAKPHCELLGKGQKKGSKYLGLVC